MKFTHHKFNAVLNRHFNRLFKRYLNRFTSIETFIVSQRSLKYLPLLIGIRSKTLRVDVMKFNVIGLVDLVGYLGTSISNHQMAPIHGDTRHLLKALVRVCVWWYVESFNRATPGEILLCHNMGIFFFQVGRA